MPDPRDPLDLLGNATIQFWTCPDGHSEREFGAPLRQTVEWRANVAYCLTPGCRQTSRGLAPPLPPEPPEDVMKVRDMDGRIWHRDDGCWWADHRIGGLSWRPLMYDHGPLTEEVVDHD